VTLSASSTLRQVIEAVSQALDSHGIRAVLTGGACASLHARGDYLSQDLDYIIQGRVTRTELDAALATVGFTRDGASYTHPRSLFFVEFPVGPLAIGDDDLVEPVVVRVGRSPVLCLSPTDSCRDRLAAFYHWNDRQSLEVAVRIACHQRVNMRVIRSWSVREGHEPKCRAFAAAVVASRKVRRRSTGPR
jgi:hypothetical protein